MPIKKPKRIDNKNTILGICAEAELAPFLANILEDVVSIKKQQIIIDRIKFSSFCLF